MDADTQFEGSEVHGCAMAMNDGEEGMGLLKEGLILAAAQIPVKGERSTQG